MSGPAPVPALSSDDRYFLGRDQTDPIAGGRDLGQETAVQGRRSRSEIGNNQRKEAWCVDDREGVVATRMECVMRVCVDLDSHAVAGFGQFEPELVQPIAVDLVADRIGVVGTSDDSSNGVRVVPSAEPEDMAFALTAAALLEMVERLGQ